MRIIGVALLAVPMFGQTVTRVGVVAKPRAYNGQCPAQIEFIGTIHVSRYPVRVTYEWVRSDGARSPRETVDIRSAGRGVRQTWTLGTRGERLVIWEQLHVLAPTNVKSPRADVRVNCR